jgi:hypothetical protein
VEFETSDTRAWVRGGKGGLYNGYKLEEPINRVYVNESQRLNPLCRVLHNILVQYHILF